MRSRPPLELALAIGALLAACAHDAADRPGTTSTTSGTTDGVRVTNVTLPNVDAEGRLAREHCRREEACGRLAADRDDERACVARATERGRAELERAGCRPSAESAAFEGCLAAIRGASCDPELSELRDLASCRTDAICVR